MGQQQLDDGVGAAIRRPVQRGVAGLVRGVHVHSRIEQQLHRFERVGFRSGALSGAGRRTRLPPLAWMYRAMRGITSSTTCTARGPFGAPWPAASSAAASASTAGRTYLA